MSTRTGENDPIWVSSFIVGVPGWLFGSWQMLKWLCSWDKIPQIPNPSSLMLSCTCPRPVASVPKCRTGYRGAHPCPSHGPCTGLHSVALNVSLRGELTGFPHGGIESCIVHPDTGLNGTHSNLSAIQTSHRNVLHQTLGDWDLLQRWSIISHQDPEPIVAQCCVFIQVLLGSSSLLAKYM